MLDLILSGEVEFITARLPDGTVVELGITPGDAMQERLAKTAELSAARVR